jgi:hypothetical protein
MSLVLVGVGADSDNASTCPPIFEDGTFEYIPIPEQYESTMTATFASAGFSEHLEYVVYDGDRTDKFDEVKLHHDPNFDSLTFGDPGKSREGLLSLNPGDILGFYSGLTPPNQAKPKHRYLIGYFTVEKVIDFNSLDEAALELAMEQNSENAHIKRYMAGNDVGHLSDLVIVRGREPGTLLEKAIKLSGGRPDARNYYFQDKWIEAWNPSTDYLGGRKPVIRSDISQEEFIESISAVE